MALTPGVGSNNGMGLSSRRKWDKWVRWMVTSECQTACGGWDSGTNKNAPCVTRDRPVKIFVPDPPLLIKDRIPKGARKRSGADDLRACMIAVQIYTLFILDSGPPPLPLKTERRGGSGTIVDR
jgi:hypothetical protein